MADDKTKRYGLIKTIYAGKKALGLDEETYRAVLESATGFRSLRDMKRNSHLLAVVNAMRNGGFRQAEQDDPWTWEQRQKIKALWWEMHQDGIINNASEKALDAYCKRICGANLGSLAVKQCQVVIETLKKWWDRAADPESHERLNAILAGKAEKQPASGGAAQKEPDAAQ